MSTFKEKYGPWALITGASSGIGEEFAWQLAEKGLNLVLVARRKERLDALAKELKEKHTVQVETIQADLTQPSAVSIIKDYTDGFEIGLLVNNAGIETKGSFLNNDLYDETRLLQLNVIAPMQLTQVFAKDMVHRNKGGVLLISSAFGYQAVPYFSNYAASKSYILTFGESLYHELKKYNVDVAVLSPGLTSTEMASSISEKLDFSKTPMKMMDVTPVVKTGIEALGRKSSVVSGGLNKAFIFSTTRLMPRQSAGKMFGDMMEKAMDKDLTTVDHAVHSEATLAHSH